MSITAVSTALAPVSAPVAPEFSGLARRFRDRVTAADRLFQASFDIVLDELTDRFKRKPMVPPRPDQCTSWIARLKAAGTMPGFRTGSLIDRSRKGFYIYGLRLIPARFGHDDWAGGQTDLGVSVVEYGAKFTIDRTVGKGKLCFPSETFAMFNLHALARFYQRSMGGDRSDAALSTALIATAPAVQKEYLDAAASKDASGFDADNIRVAVDGGGQWIGQYGTVRNSVDEDEENESWFRPVLMVRTFI